LIALAGKSPRRLTPIQAAYVAGIIDGEGTITLTRLSRRQNRRVVVSVSSTELSLLLYLRSVIGMGRLTTKVRARQHHSQSFTYTLSSRQALGLLKQVVPHLRTYKLARASMVLKKYVRLTPRNGRYTPSQRLARQAFEAQFFGVSTRALNRPVGSSTTG
jgi:hypothetical protein